MVMLLGFTQLGRAEPTLLHDEPPGTVITFSGYQWIILEQMPNGETYVLLNNELCTRAFDPDNTNLFDPNDSNNIAYYLNNDFYNSLSQKDLIADHTWDRISVDANRNNSTDYGSVTCKIGLLSYREYERYSSYYYGDILPSNYSNWWWTRTPRAGYSNYVWFVRPSGNLDYNLAYNAGGSVRPALYLKSGILISENKEVIGTEQGAVPPETPSLLEASVSGKEVTLTWEAVSGAGSYIVQRSMDGTNWTEVAETSQTSYLDTVPRYNTTYYYRVFAKSSEGVLSDPSDVVEVTTPPVPVPANFQVTLEGNTANLTWDPVEGVTLYLIERSTDGTTWEYLAETNGTSYQDADLELGQTYYYRLYAEDGSEISEPTEPVMVQVPETLAPAQLELTWSVDGTTVELTWTCLNADSYRVYINGDLESDQTETTYTFTGERGETYAVRVVAYNEWGEAEATANISISQFAPPSNGEMARDILTYTGLVAAPIGSLLALGLALKASPTLISLIRMLFFR